MDMARFKWGSLHLLRVTVLMFVCFLSGVVLCVCVCVCVCACVCVCV